MHIPGDRTESTESTLVYRRILPSVALSLVFGNFNYRWLAYQQRQREQRLGYHWLTLRDQYSQLKCWHFLGDAVGAVRDDEFYYKKLLLSST